MEDNIGCLVLESAEAPFLMSQWRTFWWLHIIVFKFVSFLTLTLPSGVQWDPTSSSTFTIAHMFRQCVHGLRNLSLCISHLDCKYYCYITYGYGNVWLIVLLGSKSTPATKTIAVTVTTKIKTNEQNSISIKTTTFVHFILPLIFKKSVVTIILNLWRGPNWPQQAWLVVRS